MSLADKNMSVLKIDTYSSAMTATAHTGETSRDVIRHWQRAFSVLGVPLEIKTDRGPAYNSRPVSQFLSQWGISHKFGIPHSPMPSHRRTHEWYS